MNRLVVLGSSNSIPSESHEHTHLLVQTRESTVLVDAASNPILRLERAGIAAEALTDVILTHFHPDHVSGIPLLLMDLWLMGRQNSLVVHGLGHTLDRLEQLMDAFGWSAWPGFYPVEFHRIPSEEMSTVLESESLRVLASPVHHLVPTIGIRFEVRGSGAILAYSSDTEPCAEVVRLADGAGILIHEAAGEGKGHSSAEQAGEIATRAEVGQLLLIHYPTGRYARGDEVASAKSRFQGPVSLAEDFMELNLDP